VITGAKGGKVKVDGVERDYFGGALSLDVGTHTFEFLPPNAECCVPPAPLVKEVPPGEKELVVVGEIPFRDAVLRFEAPAGYQASCGMLGTFSRSGEQRPVRMTAPTMSVSCTVEPPGSSGQPPKVIHESLHPGLTSTISWKRAAARNGETAPE
jgi:hypothetical protein